MDIYKEFMIKQKRRPLPLVIAVSLWGLALVSTPFAVTLSLVTHGLSVPLCAALYYLAWRYTNETNVEFEYIFTNGELDVDKISGKQKRKRYITVAVSKFDICAKAEGEQFVRFEKDPSIKITFDASKGPDTSDRYYAVFHNKDGNRMLLLFSPAAELLELIRQYNPSRTVIEE